jgi:hypothetical protein
MINLSPKQALRKNAELVTAWDEAMEKGEENLAKALSLQIKALRSLYPAIERDIDPPAEITDPLP